MLFSALLIVTAWAASLWPLVLVAVAPALPAVLSLRRRVSATLPALAVVAVSAGAVLTRDPAALWLVVLTLCAGSVGALADRRYRSVSARLDEARARAAATSVRDDLTGCANRAGMLQFGDHLLQSVRRRGESMHALVVDVDGLGRVNERLGRQAGDDVLVAVADALRSATRGTDICARGEQDDFAVVGPGSGVSPGELERRVRAHLVDSPPVPLDAWPCRVTAGLAVHEPWDGGDVPNLLARAQEDLGLRSALRAPSAPESTRLRDGRGRRERRDGGDVTL